MVYRAAADICISSSTMYEIFMCNPAFIRLTSMRFPVGSDASILSDRKFMRSSNNASVRLILFFFEKRKMIKSIVEEFFNRYPLLLYCVTIFKERVTTPNRLYPRCSSRSSFHRFCISMFITHALASCSHRAVCFQYFFLFLFFLF